jgi:hypothetical protein
VFRLEGIILHENDGGMILVDEKRKCCIDHWDSAERVRSICRLCGEVLRETSVRGFFGTSDE